MDPEEDDDALAAYVSLRDTDWRVTLGDRVCVRMDVFDELLDMLMSNVDDLELERELERVLP